MKARLFFLTMVAAALTLYVLGCQLSTTVVVEEGHDVRLVNKSGEKVKVRWAGDSYRYLDAGGIIIIPADEGYYELEWADPAPHTHTKTYRIEVEADIDIVFRDEPDIIIIER